MIQNVQPTMLSNGNHFYLHVLHMMAVVCPAIATFNFHYMFSLNTDAITVALHYYVPIRLTMYSTYISRFAMVYKFLSIIIGQSIMKKAHTHSHWPNDKPLISRWLKPYKYYPIALNVAIIFYSPFLCITHSQIMLHKLDATI